MRDEREHSDKSFEKMKKYAKVVEGAAQLSRPFERTLSFCHHRWFNAL